MTGLLKKNWSMGGRTVTFVGSGEPAYEGGKIFSYFDGVARLQKEGRMDNAHVIAYLMERVRVLDRGAWFGTLMLSTDEYHRVRSDLFQRIQRETSFHG